MGSPYFRFGIQHRYPFQWSGAQGGVMGVSRSGEARELSGADMIESGLTTFSMPYPAFSRTRLHAVGSYELARPAGPEPLLEAVGLSDMEKKSLWIGAAALGAFLLYRSGKRRRR